MNFEVNQENSFIIGIDLGTTNSVISYWNFDLMKPEPIDISFGFGQIPMPSVVQYREKQWVIGSEAYNTIAIYPDNTVSSIKRLMGSNEQVVLENKKFTPEQISSKILKELVNSIYKINPKAEINGAVVSVPYDFDDSAKKATLKACELSGIPIICLIEEPKAAALNYNFKNQLNEDEKIMIFDFGGGTLDITLLHVEEKNQKKIKINVINEGGEAYHGGDNVDEMLLNKYFNIVEQKTGNKKESLTSENKAELMLKARETKERLSGATNYRVPFTFCIPPFMEKVSRDDFENLIEGFIFKTKQLILKSLKETKLGNLKPDDISKIIVEGGSSNMPWVKKILLDIFGENKVYMSDTPAIDISLGATYYAAMKKGVFNHPDICTTKPKIEFDVTIPHDIGIEVYKNNKKQFANLIKRGTSYSLANKSKVFTLTGNSEEKMTTFDLTILERLNKDDTVEKCKVIGTITLNNLPKRPSGKTRVKITLLVEENGLVKCTVEDLGFNDEYKATDYKKTVIPKRYENTNINK